MLDCWQLIILESMQMQETQTQENTSNVRAMRIQKLADFADKEINPYPYSYDKNASAKQLQDK